MGDLPHAFCWEQLNFGPCPLPKCTHLCSPPQPVPRVPPAPISYLLSCLWSLLLLLPATHRWIWRGQVCTQCSPILLLPCEDTGKRTLLGGYPWLGFLKHPATGGACSSPCEPWVMSSLQGSIQICKSPFPQAKPGQYQHSSPSVIPFSVVLLDLFPTQWGRLLRSSFSIPAGFVPLFPHSFLPDPPWSFYLLWSFL